MTTSSIPVVAAMAAIYYNGFKKNLRKDSSMEKIFLFHCPKQEQVKIKQAASNLKIPCSIVPDEDYSQTLGAITTGKKNPLTASFTGEIPQDSLLLFCGISDKRLDKLLFALKKAQVSVDFKAILTPVNQSWTVPQLLLQMQKEKAAYTGL